MKHNKIPNFNSSVLETFLKNLREYLPLNKSYNPQISNEKQKKVLDRLRMNSDNRVFSFVIDGISEKLIHPVGISKYLGYSEDTFSIADFLGLTHPQHSIEHWITGVSIWNLLDKHKKFATFDDIQFVHQLALKHVDGSFLFCTCNAFIFQISDCGKAISYGYQFSILKNWEGEHFSSSIADKLKIREDILELLKNEKIKNFIESKIFLDSHMPVLRQLAYLEEKTSKSVADNLELTQNTIKSHNKELLKRAKDVFHKDFKNSLNLAEYLRNQSLI
ncbi:MAG: hypothetical protein IPP32_12735 [Bacteroidetes bacterium]|nr:hypothetical protein [Bacteroidota bacterium]